ncbi:hypothetical protein BAMA111019_15165 [Bacillus manliponensis]
MPKGSIKKKEVVNMYEGKTQVAPQGKSQVAPEAKQV